MCIRDRLWIIPSEFTEALKGMSTAFAGSVADVAQRTEPEVKPAEPPVS